MSLIECHNIHRDYSGTVVLESVDFSIDPGEKVGLVGANGAGKSTFLNILAGVDEDFRGSRIQMPRSLIGYLPQQVEPEGGVTALEWLCAEASAARAALRAAEEALAQAGAEREQRAMRDYERALEAYEAEGGDAAEDRARRAIALVGLSGREEVPAASLSGGERGTLALARALRGNPELLVLDEPGNHLDFWGLAWLEDFVSRSQSAAVIVSHNRTLLDRTVSRIVELEGGRARRWAGGYSAYRLEKLRLANAQGADWQASRRKIERLEEMVRRCAVRAAAYTKRGAKSNGSLGQVLRARRRQLEREKEYAVARPELGSTAITESFAGRGAGEAKADWALVVDGYSRAWGDRVLFEDARFDVLRGERVAIVGPNGCGKTTFLRDLVEKGDWDSGSLRVGPSMRVGYVAQDRDGFRRGRSIREEFEALGLKEAGIRSLLRGFGFGSDAPDRVIEALSGGELNRLQLARAIVSGSTFLVLDEPTNHLDLDARESVEERLSEYEGTILLVSHDRYFIEQIADRIVYIRDRGFEAFEGRFEEFWRDIGASLAPLQASSAAGEGLLSRGRTVERAKSAGRSKSGTTGRPADAAGPRAARKDLRAIEGKILALEAEKERLERASREAFDRRDFKRGSRLSTELSELVRDIERLYASWA